ncbi:MAG TPA: hypothetical protein VIA62_21945 [Thermoanaerobaculia bacterium]|jgi:hypothetical protein|nr:hypothetical protein [Thermoanaerobaculia bacterium]
MTRRNLLALPERHQPYWLLLALIGGAFLAATLAPYRVDVDTGFQLRSLQQWVRSESPNPGTLRLPDPHDLSRDALVWSTWWPPGFPFLYSPLAAAGLSLAATLRITSFLLFLAGSLGWLRLAGLFGLGRTACLLYAVSLAAYGVTIGGAATLPWADVLSYAFAPWLVALALRQGEGETSPLRLLLAGLALGCSYWLKYTLFLVALPLAGWLALRVGPGGRGPWTARAGRLAALALGFALPVAALLAVDLRHAASLSASASGSRSAWVAEEKQDAGPFPIALGLAGAPGLALFQNHVWITHLVYFSDGWLPFFRFLSNAHRLRAKSLLGIPMTTALIWGLALGLRGQTRGALPSLALTVTAGFYLLLTAISLLIGYDYLANEPRFGVAILPLVQAPALAGWLAGAGPSASRSRRIASALLLVIFFGVPLLFLVADLSKHQIASRRAAPYTASSTGLFMPEISPRNVPEVQAAVAAALRSPRDVVVLAGPLGWGSPLMMWLEFPWRTLPETTFFDPLGAGYRDAASLRSGSPLTASRPLRVVLVVAKSLAAGGELPRLQARFPQARVWQAAPAPAHANVVLWFSDLEVP